ncbi:MAG: hypothetical protein ABI439_07865 [Rhodospirillales bacterium]
MQIRNLKIDPILWKEIPAKQQVLFLTLGHIANELSALQKILIISWNTKNTTKIETEAQAFLSLLITKLLIVKICAAWDAIQSQTGVPDFKEYGEDHEVLEPMRRLKRYFSGDNLLRYIRNTVGAHYDQHAATASLTTVSSDAANLYMSREFGNSLYGISEELFFQTITKKATVGETPLDVINIMVRETNETSKWLIAFVQAVNMKIARKYLFEDWVKSEPEVTEIADINIFDLKLPFFIKVS